MASWFVHHGVITGGDYAKESWRIFFAESIVEWQKSKQEGKTT
jgi:L-fucose isomerase-like protein